jgi:ADP-ribose pyrophosphatase YjhB (NUDIX family)
VEVVVATAAGVLLTRRETGPCQGLWHIPGGTVRFGEPLTDAVQRVALQELGLEVSAGPLLGYIEYPSHLLRGLDWPVGIAFRAEPATSSASGRPASGSSAHRLLGKPGAAGWFAHLPDNMHDEQKAFLKAHGFAG